MKYALRQHVQNTDVMQPMGAITVSGGISED
jgi:hypothetical protein